MSQVDDILQQALALPAADRVSVVEALQASLSPTAPTAGSIAGDEFLAELQRRSAEFKNGTMSARPAAEVIADLRRTMSGGQQS